MWVSLSIYKYCYTVHISMPCSGLENTCTSGSMCLCAAITFTKGLFPKLFDTGNISVTIFHSFLHLQKSVMQSEEKVVFMKTICT